MTLLDILIKRFREGAFGQDGRIKGQKKWFEENLPKVKVDELYLSIALAHTDMARRAQGHTNEVKKASVEWWYGQFINNSPFNKGNMSDFDKWHCDVCVGFCAYMENIQKDKKQFPKKFEMRLGRAQKILNMTFKYLYCTGTYKTDVEKILSFLHMTLDGYTLRWYKDNVVPSYGLKKGDVPEWSKMNEKGKHQYISLICDDGIQNRIRCYLKNNNNYKYVINTEDIAVDTDGGIDDTLEKTQALKPVDGDSITVSLDPFYAEFVIWEGEIVRAKMESLFKGLNGCYKSWKDDEWTIGAKIKAELKSKLDKIYPYL